MPGDEELAPVTRHHDAYTTLLALGDERQSVVCHDVLSSDGRMSAVGHEELIVEASEYRQRTVECLLAEDAEKFPRQSLLLYAIMVVEPRLSRPADIKGASDVCFRPLHDLFHLLPVGHFFKGQALYGSPRNDHPVHAPVHQQINIMPSFGLHIVCHVAKDHAVTMSAEIVLRMIVKIQEGRVLYINNGNTLWLNMNVQGSLDTEDAAIIFASVPGTEPCKITYDANGGALTDSITSIRRKGEWISRFDVKASKDGVYFCGWYDGPDEDARRIYPTDEVKKDMTVYAHYSPYGVEIGTFDFGFSTPGDPGSLVHHLIIPIQEDGTYGIVQYLVIERDGKVIRSWKVESGNTAAQTGLTGSHTFTAEWVDASEIGDEVQSEAQSEPEETVAETETEA